MINPTSQTAKERAALSRLRKILNEPGVLRANFVKMRRPCGTQSCRCARGKRHWHVSWYVNQSKNGKLRMKCVPKEQLEEVQAWVTRYQEARKLLAIAGDERWDRIGKQHKRKR